MGSCRLRITADEKLQPYYVPVPACMLRAYTTWTINSIWVRDFIAANFDLILLQLEFFIFKVNRFEGTEKQVIVVGGH